MHSNTNTMAKEIYRRYLWLTDTIRSAKNGITFEQISDKWQRCSLNPNGEELPKRTFRNWLNSLPTALGVVVECEKKSPFRYRIANREIERNDLLEWSLNALSLGNIVSENSVIHDRIILEDIPSANEKLNIICSAMRNGHLIWMHYQPFDTDYDYSFNTKPYAIKLAGNRWYLIAHSDSHDKDFCYGLDRILEVKELEESFDMPKDYSAQEKFKYSIGIYAGEQLPIEEVTLKVSGYLQDYMETLPLHWSQRVVERDSNSTTYGYTMRCTYELVDKLTGLGSFCQVLMPLSLRQQVRENALKIAEIYK